MALDESTDTLLKNIAAMGGPALNELPVDECRNVFLGLVQNLQGDVLPIHESEDREISGPNGAIPIRIYTPSDSQGKSKGVLVLFHGGGWVIGDLETHDNMCRYYANEADVVVVAVDNVGNALGTVTPAAETLERVVPPPVVLSVVAGVEPGSANFDWGAPSPLGLALVFVMFGSLAAVLATVFAVVSPAIVGGVLILGVILFAAAAGPIRPNASIPAARTFRSSCLSFPMRPGTEARPNLLNACAAASLT